MDSSWERTFLAADDRQTLRVASEYLCYPLWLTVGGGGTDNLRPEDLDLPADLIADLNAWSDEYDAIFPEDDPGSATFPSSEAEADFYARGRALAERTTAAVGSRYRVTYVDRNANATNEAVVSPD